jgi:hypothetical protein
VVSVEARRRRKPLVYATLAAQRAAEEVLPGKVIEVEVERAIEAGRLVGGPSSGRVITDGWRALVVRSRGRRDPTRWAWLVTDVESTVRTRRDDGPAT